MPRNGSGTYSLPNNTWNPASSGITISSTDWNSTAADLVTAISASIANDGQTVCSAAIPFAQGFTVPNGVLGIIGSTPASTTGHSGIYVGYTDTSASATSWTSFFITDKTTATTGTVATNEMRGLADAPSGTINAFFCSEAFLKNQNAGNVTEGRGYSSSAFLTGAGNITTWKGYESLATAATGSGAAQTVYHYHGGTWPTGFGTIAKIGLGIDDTASHNYLGGTLVVGNTTTTPTAGAAMDVQSTTGGLGVPSMTTTQRDAISAPRDGLLIYNSTLGKFQGRAGAAWGNITLS